MRAAFRKILLFASRDIQCDVTVRYGNKVPLDQISAVGGLNHNHHHGRFFPHQATPHEGTTLTHTRLGNTTLAYTYRGHPLMHTYGGIPSRIPMEASPHTYLQRHPLAHTYVGRASPSLCIPFATSLRYTCKHAHIHTIIAAIYQLSGYGKNKVFSGYFLQGNPVADRVPHCPVKGVCKAFYPYISSFRARISTLSRAV